MSFPMSQQPTGSVRVRKNLSRSGFHTLSTEFQQDFLKPKLTTDIIVLSKQFSAWGTKDGSLVILNSQLGEETIMQLCPLGSNFVITHICPCKDLQSIIVGANDGLLQKINFTTAQPVWHATLPPSVLLGLNESMEGYIICEILSEIRGKKKIIFTSDGKPHIVFPAVAAPVFAPVPAPAHAPRPNRAASTFEIQVDPMPAAPKKKKNKCCPWC